MKIYVASSWRNEYQQEVVRQLRAAGHEVYDFKNPPGLKGFAWHETDPKYGQWTASEYREALRHPTAEACFKSDFDAMKWADACLMVQPCGRSAALELGWSAGAGKLTLALLAEGQDPELMLKMCDCICLSMYEVLFILSHVEECKRRVVT